MQVEVNTFKRYATAIYNLRSSSEECAECDADLEERFSSQLCASLRLSDCSRVTSECVKGRGLKQDMDVLLFLPAQVRIACLIVLTAVYCVFWR